MMQFLGIDQCKGEYFESGLKKHPLHVEKTSCKIQKLVLYGKRFEKIKPFIESVT